MGVPPVVTENILLHRLLTLNIFTMQKVLPKCKCGADVYVQEYQEPVYDESGGLASVELGLYEWSTCFDCSKQMVEDNSPRKHEDELPF
jgi:hypothetical protein